MKTPMRKMCTMRVVQVVCLLLLVSIFAHLAPPHDVIAQVRESPKPPALLQTAGNFRVARLTSEPVVDGREWIEADVRTTSEDGAVPVPTKAFSLTATAC